MTVKDIRNVAFALHQLRRHYGDREFCLVLFSEIWGERLGRHFYGKFEKDDPSDFLLSMDDGNIERFKDYAASVEMYRAAAYKKLYSNGDKTGLQAPLA